jgi:hypothetical protein
MNTLCVRKLLVLLLCIFGLTSGLPSIATEHKTSEHSKVSQTSPSSASKGTSNSSSDAEGDSKKSATDSKLPSPDAEFEALRQSMMKRLLEYKVLPGHPVSAKLLESLKSSLTKYFNVPLVLKDKKVDDNTAVLTYQSGDPKIDMSLTVLMVASGNTWSISSWSIKGQQGEELKTEVMKDITDSFPTQITLMWVFVFALLVSCLAYFAAIWLDVVAFKTSLGWGFATLLLPGAGIVFAILNWQAAKKPFLTAVGSGVVIFLTFLIPVWVGYSLGDVTSTFNDLMPKTVSTGHEI